MYYYDDDDDDDEFGLVSQLNTLEKNISHQTIEKMNHVEEIRQEKINKLRLEEENAKAIYDAHMRDIEQRMSVLINTTDDELFANEFNNELNHLETQFNNIIGSRKHKKDRTAIGMGIRIGDKIQIGNEWVCECIGLEKKGLYGILKSPHNEILQGQQFNSLNKIYQMYIKTFGKKKRSIYGSKNVEWFRDGKSLGGFI